VRKSGSADCQEMLLCKTWGNNETTTKKTLTKLNGSFLSPVMETARVTQEKAFLTGQERIQSEVNEACEGSKTSRNVFRHSVCSSSL